MLTIPRMLALPARLVLILVLGSMPILGFANDDFELSRDGDLLSLQADKASLVAIIDRLEELTEIKMTFSEPFDTPITADIEDVDLEGLISRLVSNSLIKKLDYQSHIKIAEVLLMPDGGESNVAAASLPTGEPAEGVIVDENGEQPGLAAASTGEGDVEAPTEEQATGADPVDATTQGQ